MGTSTYPANANEGTHFIAHRAALAMPVLPGQVHLGDAAYDVSANYQWIRDRGGIAVFAYNPRSERTNSYDQEVIANGRPLRMRGLDAFRFAGAIRTFAQPLRRALNFVLDVTLTLGETACAQT